MSNIVDIYNTLVRIQSDNHVAKKKDIYSRRQIKDCYRRKAIEINRITKRIDETKPRSINYVICYQYYNNKECYLYTFSVIENKKYHLPSRTFQFHLPIVNLGGEKENEI